ncbi:MAG: hypothetical protein QM714_00160 [Nocardioides sp.]|uniref:hypothetical protein n=1 Tax=Nocardioides sp. TaxID=35761 RepID=UPI0039E40F74
MTAPADNSALLQAADDIRAYEYARGQESRQADLDAAQATIADLRAQLAALTKPATLFGVNLANATPGLVPAVARIYFAGGDFDKTQTWAGSKAAAAYDAGTRTFVVSVKDYTAAQMARLGAYLDTVPDDAVILGCHWHEMEDDILRKQTLTAEAYRTRFEVVKPVFRSRGHGFGPIHNGMTWTGGKWVWGSGYVEPDLTDCTFWGFDCYDPNGKGPQLFQPVIDYASQHGLPLVVGETATPAGPKQAAWAAEARAWFAERVVVACWWHQQFAGKPDYVMSAETQAAWLG